MPKIKQITKEQSLIDEYADIKYFCPYSLCRSLFKDIHNDHKVQVVKKGYNYQCIHCKRHFNRSTYGDNHKCGKKYQIDTTINMTTDKYIESHIENLWNKGYTNRDIHTITHFSRTLIGKITKKFRDQVINMCTIDEFNKKYLSDLDNKYPLIPSRDLRTHKIRKACRLGCSVSQIAKILKIGNNTIVKAKSGRYLAEDKKADILQEIKNADILQKMIKNSFSHHVIPSDKKIVLTDEQSKYIKLVEDFVKNAELPITHNNKNNKNRTRITINAEDGRVRVYGTSDKKKYPLSPYDLTTPNTRPPAY
ncbi:MAG: hypothetical protein GQ531_03140 [Sulfurovum sp.]|nr:hypothetical protein [Sulfurovum sp.]